MKAQYIIEQGTVGVSRLEGKFLGVPFLTLVVPMIPVNKPHSQTNLKQDIQFITIEVLTWQGLSMVNLNLWSIGWIHFIPLDLDVVMVS